MARTAGTELREAEQSVIWNPRPTEKSIMQSVPRQQPGIHQRVPLLGQTNGMSAKETAQMQIAQAVDQMSITLYLRFATDRIASGDNCELLEQFRDTAKLCRDVAKAYFEGVGAIKQDSDHAGAE